MVTVKSEQNHEGVTLTIKIPADDLFLFTDNQVQMLTMANDKTIVDQLRIIFIMLLEVLSRGAKHGAS
jgi:hypothetical protein